MRFIIATAYEGEFHEMKCNENGIKYSVKKPIKFDYIRKLVE